MVSIFMVSTILMVVLLSLCTFLRSCTEPYGRRSEGKCSWGSYGPDDQGACRAWREFQCFNRDGAALGMYDVRLKDVSCRRMD